MKRSTSRPGTAAICANLPLQIAALDASIGRKAPLQESPRQRPESAPKPPFDCEREIAFTALREIPNRTVTHLPRGTIGQLIHPPTARRGPLPSRLHRAEAKVRRDLADLAARFEEVNAETILEIRALRNEITHMHMIDAAIATERDERLWLN